MAEAIARYHLKVSPVFFWGAFAGLIISLFFLEIIYLSSGEQLPHSFIDHWFGENLSWYALTIIFVSVIAGTMAAAWYYTSNMLSSLVQENDSLKEINKSKTELISFATHEIRSPVTGLNGALNMMLKNEVGVLTEDQRKILTQSYDAVQEISSLANEFLDASKIDNQKFELVLNPVPVQELLDHINNIIDDFKLIAEDKGVVVHVVTAPNINPSLNVMADPPRIYEVVRNLIQNAINYTPTRGLINVGFMTNPNGFQVSVSDSGIGIPENERSMIFGKFFRAGNAKKLQSTGTGLGLYLCRKIIEGHQGKIWFHTEEGKGTTFCFFILRAQNRAQVEELFRKI